MLIERQVDGVLLVPARSSGETFRLLQAHRMPVVVHRPPGRGADVDSVRCDSEAGAYALAKHLVELGHRRIAVLTGRRNVSTSVGPRRRVPPRPRGGRPGAARRARPLGRLQLRQEQPGRRSPHGARDARRRRASGPPRVFCANNFIGFGAIRALREAGLRVPDDMSVVAFDDLPEEWVSEPFLTVAAQPAYEIGHRAAMRAAHGPHLGHRTCPTRRTHRASRSSCASGAVPGAPRPRRRRRVPRAAS